MMLHFQELGSGPPLIMMHGLLGSHHNLLPAAEKLAPHFRVFALDLRNHGASPQSDEFNYGVMAADVAVFLREQNISRANVLGHSMGGKVAMHFALAHPETVERLIVVDMSPRAYLPRFEVLLDTMLALDLGKYHRRSEIGEALIPAVPDVATRQFLLKNVAQDGNGAFRWRPNLAGIRRNYLPLVDAVESQGTFDGPTLFVRGSESDFIRDEDGDLIRQLFPSASIETIQGARHWVHAEKPEEFAVVVKQFLLRQK